MSSTEFESLFPPGSCKKRIPPAEPTSRQREILKLVGQGLTNRQIAEKLGIKPGTVKSHIHNVLQTLGVENRLEAFVKARDEIGSI